jgi:hypothetical protein
MLWGSIEEEITLCLLIFYLGSEHGPFPRPTPRTLVVGGPQLTPAIMIIPPAMATMCVFMKQSVALAFWY